MKRQKPVMKYENAHRNTFSGVKKIAYFWQRINNHNNGRDKALDRYAATRR